MDDVRLSGRMAWYVTPEGFFSVMAASPSLPVVPGTTGPEIDCAVARVRPVRATARKVVECILELVLLSEWKWCCGGETRMLVMVPDLVSVAMRAFARQSFAIEKSEGKIERLTRLSIEAGLSNISTESEKRETE